MPSATKSLQRPAPRFSSPAKKRGSSGNSNAASARSKPRYDTPTLSPLKMNMDSRIPYEFRVAVTGHRNIPDEPAVVRAIQDVAGRIGRTLADADATPLAWTIISPLARGADQLAARTLLEGVHARLEVITPFPLAEYRKDFSANGELAQFEALLACAAAVHELPYSGHTSEMQSGYPEALKTAPRRRLSASGRARGGGFRSAAGDLERAPRRRHRWHRGDRRIRAGARPRGPVDQRRAPWTIRPAASAPLSTWKIPPIRPRSLPPMNSPPRWRNCRAATASNWPISRTARCPHPLRKGNSTDAGTSDGGGAGGRTTCGGPRRNLRAYRAAVRPCRRARSALSRQACPRRHRRVCIWPRWPSASPSGRCCSSPTGSG